MNKGNFEWKLTLDRIFYFAYNQGKQNAMCGRREENGDGRNHGNDR